jgi:hypothetical protein
MYDNISRFDGINVFKDLIFGYDAVDDAVSNRSEKEGPKQE